MRIGVVILVAARCSACFWKCLRTASRIKCWRFRLCCLVFYQLALGDLFLRQCAVGLGRLGLGFFYGNRPKAPTLKLLPALLRGKDTHRGLWSSLAIGSWCGFFRAFLPLLSSGLHNAKLLIADSGSAYGCVFCCANHLFGSILDSLFPVVGGIGIRRCGRLLGPLSTAAHSGLHYCPPHQIAAAIVSAHRDCPGCGGPVCELAYRSSREYTVPAWLS